MIAVLLSNLLKFPFNKKLWASIYAILSHIDVIG